ncbi:hypothetical protein STEG23_005190 [Scotinomys teguina]
MLQEGDKSILALKSNKGFLERKLSQEKVLGYSLEVINVNTGIIYSSESDSFWVPDIHNIPGAEVPSDLALVLVNQKEWDPGLEESSLLFKSSSSSGSASGNVSNILKNTLNSGADPQQEQCHSVFKRFSYRKVENSGERFKLYSLELKPTHSDPPLMSFGFWVFQEGLFDMDLIHLLLGPTGGGGSLSPEGFDSGIPFRAECSKVLSESPSSCQNHLHHRVRITFIISESPSSSCQNHLHHIRITFIVSESPSSSCKNHLHHIRITFIVSESPSSCQNHLHHRVRIIFIISESPSSSYKNHLHHCVRITFIIVSESLSSSCQNHLHRAP